jgi:hypothetical protein
MFSAFLNGLKERGCTGFKNETCGMHIHISKKGMTSLHILKFMKMVYDYPLLTLLVSQRKSEQLSSWANLDSKKRKTLLQEAKNKLNTGNRHAAVNLTEHTVELRIFKSNIKYSAFMKNVEYTQALYDFTKDCSVHQATPANFFEFIYANKYSYLQQWLNEREANIKELFNITLPKQNKTCASSLSTRSEQSKKKTSKNAGTEIVTAGV